MAKILIGVAGSIAAYRSPDFVRALRAEGHELRIVVTHAGLKFVGEKTLETFAQGKIISNDPWDETHLGTDHISGARWADLVVIYGATANFLAKLAGGFADDFLTQQILATHSVPVILCPAMNVEMWEHPATQANVTKLIGRGTVFVGPVPGDLACGESGLGHIASHSEILAQVQTSLTGVG